MLVISGGGTWGRVRDELPDISAREIFTYCVKSLFKFLVDNAIVLGLSIESGFFECLCESIRLNSLGGSMFWSVSSRMATL